MEAATRVSKEDARIRDLSTFVRALKVERAERNGAWRVALAPIMHNILFAFLEEAVTGPDGMRYYLMATPPKDGAKFSGGAIVDAAAALARKCLGVAINFDGRQADWFFSFGDIWSLAEYGSFYEDPYTGTKELKNFAEVSDSSSKFPLASSRSATLNEVFLPFYVRQGVATFYRSIAPLRDRTPEYMLREVADPAKPFRLYLNFFPEDFATPSQFKSALHALSWYFPLKRSPHVLDKSQYEALRHEFKPLV